MPSIAAGIVQDVGPVSTDFPAGFSFYSDTFHSIGIRWDLDVSQDPDYNATVSLRYRKKGTTEWKNGANLLRNDWDWWWGGSGNTYANRPHQATHYCFAGSLMFLTPGTTYQVEAIYEDPDGAEPSRTVAFEATTRAIPVKPTGSIKYCVEGSSGGDGSSGNPWQGLGTANSNASPGDVIRLRPTNGAFTEATLTTSGAEGNYIVYEEDPDDTGAVVDSVRIDADHIWISGLTFTHDGVTTDQWQQMGIYVHFSDATIPDDIVVTDCTLSGYAKGAIRFEYGISRGVFIDNDITGLRTTTEWETTEASTSDEYGVRCGGEDTHGGPGNIVAYNTIRQTIEGINMGYRGNDTDKWGRTGSNCDAFGNKVYWNTGNAISTDASRENIRVWGNKFAQSGSSPLTFQPQRAGPWYFLYNQIVEHTQNFQFKWRVQDRCVFINNTFAGQGVNNTQGQHIMYSYCRNNLWIKETARLWNSVNNHDTSPDVYRDPLYDAGWQTDIDYDGIDVGGSSNEIIRWDDNTNSITGFSNVFSQVGIWENGVHVDADLIFTDKTYSHSVDLLLAAGGNAAVEAGEKINNLCDFYTDAATKAPDLGCHNRADGAPQYGQRTSELSSELSARTYEWSKH